MKIKIDTNGDITTFNENERLHSFNGKPAVITPDGYLVWYNDGLALKLITPNGEVTNIRCK